MLAMFDKKRLLTEQDVLTSRCDAMVCTQVICRHLEGI